MTLRRVDPRYVWDAEVSRYRYKATGRLVPDATVQRALEDAIAKEEQRALRIGVQMQRGSLTPSEFQRQMTDVIGNVHYFSAAAGIGGWGRLNTADAGFVESRIDEQLSWLKNLTKDIRSGLPLDGQFFNRVGSYAKSGRTTYFEMLGETKAAGGMTRDRNVLHPADHCEGEGSCLEQSDLGWLRIGDPRRTQPGQRKCRGNCLCTMEYDDGPVEREPEPEPSIRDVAIAVQKSDQRIIGRPSTKYPPGQPGEEETYKLYRLSGKTGPYTPERQRLHDAILRSWFANDTTPADGQQIIYVMGGGPASGKSSMTKQLDTPNVIVSDPDRIKKQLPDYREMVAAGDVGAATKAHEESSELAKDVIAKGVAGNYNVLVDGTGDNTYEKLAGKIQGYRANGGRIVGNYVVLDVDTGLARAEERAKRPGENFGRHVPTDYLREVYRNISDIVPRAIKDGLFDDLTIWDNNGDGAARVIAHYADGKLDVVDQEAWQHFLSTAPQEKPPETTPFADVTGLLEPATHFTPNATFNPPPLPEGVDNMSPQLTIAPSTGLVDEGSETGAAVQALDAARPVDEVFAPERVAALRSDLQELQARMEATKGGTFGPGIEQPFAEFVRNEGELQKLVAGWAKNIIAEGVNPPADRMPSAVTTSFDMNTTTGAQTDPETWAIDINNNIVPDLANFLAGNRTGREWGALEVVVHEALHVLSPIHDDPTQYNVTGGQYTEELFTEALARRLTDKMWGDAPLPADRHQFAGYRDQMRAVEAIEDARPGTIDAVWSQPYAGDRMSELAKGVDAWAEKELFPTLASAGADLTDLTRAFNEDATAIDKYHFATTAMTTILDDLQDIRDLAKLRAEIASPDPADPGAAKFEATELADRLLRLLQ